MVNLRARRATAQDVDALRRLHAEAAASRSGLWSLRRGLDPAAWVASHTPTVLVGDGASASGFAVAIAEGTPLSAPRCAEVFVHIAPSLRRQGAARAALAELMTVSRTMGLWKLLGYALPEDAVARALLTRMDFREVGTLTKHVQLDNRWHDVILAERLVLSARRSSPSIPDV
ncbi:MAG: GNAT family N-acetyltransferase [Polyangiaceae bacterium]|jgi:L-amino acid N-acyltransferase YncA